MTTVSSTTSTGATKIVWQSDAADIDWTSLIEAAVLAKTARADTIDVKITANEAKVAAYETMQGLLQDLADAAEALSAPSGSSNAALDVFQDRTAYLSADNGDDATAYLGIALEEGTEATSYAVTVEQIATAHKVAGTKQASKSDELGLAGVLSLGLESGSAVEITVTEDMSLAELASAINDEAETTGVKASVLQVADGDYRLVLTATETGEEIVASAVSGTDILQSLGVTESAGAFADEVQAAQDAIMTIDGLTVTRSSNTIEDAVDGVTFYLYGVPEEDTTVTVEVTRDTDSVADAVQALVDAYNAYRDFAYSQQQVSSSGTASDDAVLFGDGTLRSVNTALASALSTVLDGHSMDLLGLSFGSDNSLELDTDVLADALENDYDAVQNLLAFSMESSSDDIGLISRGSNAPSAFTLDIEVDEDGAITAVSVGGDSSLFTVVGSRIKGVEGTDYEGLTFVFTGDASQSIDIELSQGIAELLFNAADAAGSSSGGTLQTLMDDLEDTNETLEAKSEDIRSRGEDYRVTLTARYAEYQAAIEAAQSSLDYLEAYLNASSD